MWKILEVSMGFDGLQTARSRLVAIETEKAKVDEWSSGSSRVKNRLLLDLNKEYNTILSLITSDTDLDKSIVELRLNSNFSNRKVYCVQ